MKLRLLLLGCSLVTAACAQGGDEVAPVRAAVSAPEPAPAAAPAPEPLPRIEIEGRLVQGGFASGRAAGASEVRLDGKPVPLAPDGSFVLGFDRDQGPQAMVEALTRSGRVARTSLTIAPREWDIEHVNVAQRPGGSSEEFLRRRQGELERINAARAVRSETAGWRQSFIWPSAGRISGRFGSQRIYRGTPGSFHSGVDLAPGAGARVVAPADGTVVLAGPPGFSLEGNLVILDHGMGLNSAFLHLDEVRVREGQQVRQGEPIGTVGASGRATGPHLHWSLKWLDSRLDPELFAPPR